ncbi:unnamed protein product [Arctogadus glacialis]
MTIKAKPGRTAKASGTVEEQRPTQAAGCIALFPDPPPTGPPPTGQRSELGLLPLCGPAPLLSAHCCHPASDDLCLPVGPAVSPSCQGLYQRSMCPPQRPADQPVCL